jgi:hypothetical protein
MSHSLRRLRLGGPAGCAAALLVLLAACDESSRDTGLTDPASSPPEAIEPELASAAAAGIPAGPYHLPEASFGTGGHSGSVRGVSPSSILPLLRAAKSKGLRVVISMPGSRSNYTNPDGSFNLTRWKQRLDRFRGVNFAGYVADGTIIGNYLVDEPDCASCWGGREMARADVKAAAQYSKRLWPSMPTVIQADPSWLQRWSGTWQYLDVAWVQYSARHGDLAALLARNVKHAKAHKWGLIVGLNVLDGGTSASGIRGYHSGRWAMSASQLRSYGGRMLAEPYACAFLSWQYGAGYYGRSDIKAAMAELYAKARSHAKRSCKVA